MTLHGAIAVECLSGPASAQAEQAFRLVYAETFAEPPYNETEADVTACFRRFRSQTRKQTFRAVLARTHQGEPVGIGYGYPLGPRTGWWDRITPPAPDDLRGEDGHRTFGLMELAVRTPWRRIGVARRMHAALIADAGEGRVLLNVRQDAEAARGAYRAWGYRKVGETRPWDGAPLHDVMTLVLRSETA
ncbi:hypothetical protein GCM10010387_45030 [Streptomyces inusitatus]|uniref:N-acetyltransferase domain-containing protein n=1 Tax=Streptomyces inusitatus TaxID=68221 RepID=A0A918QH84_9ACTN|nr:GNAT family N-acetyltransferase [Streptomyces inusitatus]GGZ45517.1 hypothetical protein GCM10010387_45030 [Streptomyces inusitatus]